MLKRKTFLKKKASRDISASRNLRLRRFKHRKAKQFQQSRFAISGSRYLKKANIMFAFLLFSNNEYYFLIPPNAPRDLSASFVNKPVISWASLPKKPP